MLASSVHASSLSAPIIFVHGYNGEAQTWQKYIDPWLSDQLGFANGGTIETSIENNKVKLKPHSFNKFGDYFFIQFKNRVSSIKDQVKQINRVVHGLQHKLKVTKFILVGYSMGGLSARAYLLRYPKTHLISRLVTVASPHRGTGFSLFYRLGEYCSNQNSIKTIIQGICNRVKHSADKLLGYPLDNHALRDLLPDQVPKSKKILGKIARMAHPDNIEYASVIGQSPKLFKKETFMIFIKEVAGGNVGLLNALTSEPVDWGRRFLELFQKSKYNKGTGDGIISLASQDMSQLHWFKHNSEKLIEKKDKNGEYRFYKIGRSSHMEVFKLNRHYHFRTPENISILWRAITGPTHIKTANLIDSNSIEADISGHLISTRYFKLNGIRNGKVELIPIKNSFLSYNKLKIITKSVLDNYNEVRLSYKYSTNGNYFKINTIKATKKNSLRSFIFWVILGLLLLIIYIYWNRRRNSSIGNNNDWAQ